MKTIEQTRWELFEVWYQEQSQGRLNRGMDDFTGWERNIMYYAFNAALDLIVIELPLTYDYPDTECMRMGCKDAIESTNLGIKIK